MKVSKSELKRIIKEELASVLEDKKHPGQSCEEAHTGIPHEKWEARSLEESELLDEGAMSTVINALPILRNVMMYGPMIMGLIKMLKANPKLADQAKSAGGPAPTAGGPAPTSAPDNGASTGGGWEPGKGWLEEEQTENAGE